MYACYHCGRRIRGQVQIVTPPLFVTRLTGETTKAYHPSCYARAERAAEQDLRPAVPETIIVCDGPHGIYPGEN